LFVLECWDGEPNNRPTIFQVVDMLKTIITKKTDVITENPQLLNKQEFNRISLNTCNSKSQGEMSQLIQNFDKIDTKELSKFNSKSQGEMSQLIQNFDKMDTKELSKFNSESQGELSQLIQNINKMDVKELSKFINKFDKTNTKEVEPMSVQRKQANLLSEKSSEYAKIPWNITPEEKIQYNKLFKQWDPQGLGYLTGDIAKDIMLQSGLSLYDLKQIWDLSDSNKNGKLNQNEFFIAMHLIYRKINGYDTHSQSSNGQELYKTPSNINNLKLQEEPSQHTQNFNKMDTKELFKFINKFDKTNDTKEVGSISLASKQANIPWNITFEEKIRYYKIFKQWDSQELGYLTGDIAKDIMLQSGLSLYDLKQIWDLSDSNKNGKLNQNEFFIAMHLIYKKTNGYDIHIQNFNKMDAKVKLSLFTYKFYKTNAKKVASTSVPNKQVNLLSEKNSEYAKIPWNITPEEKIQYIKIFKQYDLLGLGYITGDIAKDIMLQSGLSLNDLKQIWDLSDPNENGKLNQDEFIIAMHLIYKKLNEYGMPSQNIFSCLPNTS
jgi:hypothetical protein